MSVSGDWSELELAAAELDRVVAQSVQAFVPVVAKGAVNIKNQQRAEAAGNRYNFAGLIGYDLVVSGASVSASVGPEHKGAGALANISYFGGSYGGGGTLPDPEGALRTEQPKFEKAVQDVVEGLL